MKPGNVIETHVPLKSMVRPDRQYPNLWYSGAWLIWLAILVLVFTSASLSTHASEKPDVTSSLSQAMATAASNLLAALDSEERAGVEFPFSSDERMNWHYTPVPRKGVPFKRMTSAQQKLAYALLSTGLSARGYVKAVTIMSLEEILREMEQGKGPARDPDLYFFSIFGTPSDSEPWGWRVEGHHLSVNFELVPGQRIADTPSFFGSNPAEVRQSPRNGLRVLEREENLGRELVKSLGEAQRKLAVLPSEASAGIVPSESRNAEIKENRGLRVREMSAAQREILLALLNEYAGNMAPQLAEARLVKLRKAGFDSVVFAWKGGLEPGMPHYYRIQGPSFLIEFDNTQDEANHIHTVWRDFHGDWGEDLLADHYRNAPTNHGHSHH
jgi:uncharacterized protein DUF3500